MQRGLVYQDLNNHKFAILDFQKAIQLNENYTEAYIYLAKSYIKENQLEQAIDNFKRSMLEGENPASLDGLGQCYHMMGKFEEAIDHFDQAISLKPKDIEFLKNRA